jgi:hypothetical protein
MKNEDIKCKTEYYTADIFLRCRWPVKIYGLTEVLSYNYSHQRLALLNIYSSGRTVNMVEVYIC